MPYFIENKDIFNCGCKTVVNPTDGSYSGSGAIDSKIQKAGGKILRKRIEKLPALSAGDAQFTHGFDSGFYYIIHTFVPDCKDGEEALRDCYTKILSLATKIAAKSVALPLLSTFVPDFPKEKILDFDIECVTDFFMTDEYDGDMLVVFAVPDKSVYKNREEEGLKKYIDKNFSDDKISEENLCEDYSIVPLTEESFSIEREETPVAKLRQISHEIVGAAFACAPLIPKYKSPAEKRLEEYLLKKKSKNFRETLFEFQKNNSNFNGKNGDAKLYNKANVSRKTFNKIKNEKKYNPSKDTVILFALALELSIDDTETLLNSAGFSIRSPFKSDLIVTYYIEEIKEYNISKINESLFDAGLPLLCGKNDF